MVQTIQLSQKENPTITPIFINKSHGLAGLNRAFSMQFTKRAMLSRQAAGIRKKALIINLPGSPKAVRECLEYILPELEHGLDILQNTAHNCAR